MRNIPVFVLTLAIAAATLFGIGIVAQSQSVVVGEVQFVSGPAVRSKALSPVPGPTARQQTKKGSIGEDQVMITTTDSNHDYWVEDIDLEGNGKTSEASMLWDHTDKVLYTFADKTVMCKSGGSADGDILIATYGNGNAAKRPSGSGWWMASLDAGECGMKTDTMYGCKFNPSGKNTACGIAELNNKTHDLMIIETTTSR